MKTIIKTFSLLMILIGGWILMSRCGYLPMALSFPIELKEQAYGSPYKITGYGFENQARRFYNDDENALIPAGTFDSLGILRNNNIEGSDGFYSSDEDAFYIHTRNSIYHYRVNKNNKLKRTAKSSGYPYSSIVSFDNMFIQFSNKYGLRVSGEYNFEVLDISNISKNNLMYDYTFFRDEKGEMTHSVDYNYDGITEILQKNESEVLSLEVFSVLLYLARNNILEGWYPSSGTAIFRYSDNGKDTLVSYTLGDENVKRYGPYDISGCELLSFNETEFYMYDSNTLTIYRWDYTNNEKTKIISTPKLSEVSMYLLEDNKLFFAGIKEDNYVYIYSMEYKDPGELEIEKNYYNNLAIGYNCIFFWSTKEFSDEIKYYKCWYIRKDD